MEFIWIFFAFFCGLGVKLVQLPPLVGYLMAGFLLNALGMEPSANLETLANIGITLMLFTIGLKLNVGTLLKPEVYVSTFSITSIWILLVVALLFILKFVAVPYFVDLSSSGMLLLAFGLSFSSTVCVVKVLEENGELRTRHGKIALAILVLQDIIAVGVLVVEFS